jgi:hypothetical protein
MGQSVYLGNFDECVGVENVQTEVGPFSGQHCLVAFQGKPSSLMRSLVTHNQQSTPDFGGFRGHIRDMTGNSRTVSSLSEYAQSSFRALPKAVVYLFKQPLVTVVTRDGRPFRK